MLDWHLSPKLGLAGSDQGVEEVLGVLLGVADVWVEPSQVEGVLVERVHVFVAVVELGRNGQYAVLGRLPGSRWQVKGAVAAVVLRKREGDAPGLGLPAISGERVARGTGSQRPVRRLDLREVLVQVRPAGKD